MPQVTKAQILNKMKSTSKGAWKRARNVDAKPRSGGGFPPNLKNVVARCQSWKMDVASNDNPYFALTAIVVEPQEYENRRATFMWFIGDSEYATAEDSLNNLSSDLQLIYTDGDMPEDIDGIPDVLKELCDAGRHLLFNTGGPRKGGKSPNLFIQGPAEGFEDDPDANAAYDAANPERGGAGPRAKANGKAAPEDNPADDDPQEDDNTGDDGDLADAAAEEEFLPEVGEVYGYQANAKAKVMNVTLTKVDKKKKTIDGHAEDDKKKTFKAIPFAKLVSAV